jgi:hypothetical protein
VFLQRTGSILTCLSWASATLLLTMLPLAQSRTSNHKKKICNMNTFEALNLYFVAPIHEHYLRNDDLRSSYGMMQRLSSDCLMRKHRNV